MQRAAYDLLGYRGTGRRRPAPWLRHAAWPADEFPLRDDFDVRASYEPGTDDYPFVRVAGDGVHEIPVGPVHAGTIEPGHFRFSIVGERVLRLEERLGYKHKGIEKRFAGMTLDEGARLAGARQRRLDRRLRLGVCDGGRKRVRRHAAAARASWLRALLLERERIANHLGDLGFLGNDAGLAFGLAQFSRLKEDLLRLNADAVRPPLSDGCDRAGRRCARHRADVDWRAIRVEADAARRKRSRCCKNIYDEHAGLAGPLHRRAGASRRSSPHGSAHRARRPRERPGAGSARAVSGRALRPARRAHGDAPQRRRRGARRPCASTKSFESLRLIRQILERMPAGEIRATLPATAAGAFGIGLGRRLARRSPGRARNRRRRRHPRVATRTIRRGRTGRCSSTR